MKFKIFCRLEAETKEYLESCDISEPHIWISIYTPGDDPAKVVTNIFCKDILPISFYDTDKEYTEMGIFPMFLEQGKIIVDFVNRYKNEIDLVLVHCDAGISRSSGTAMALSLWLNGHDSGIGNNYLYSPNSHVKSTILRYIRENNL